MAVEDETGQAGQNSSSSTVPLYTVFHPLVVEVSCVLFLGYACWLGQKQNTLNFYHKRMKYGVFIVCCGNSNS